MAQVKREIVQQVSLNARGTLRKSISRDSRHDRLSIPKDQRGKGEIEVSSAFNQVLKVKVTVLIHEKVTKEILNELSRECGALHGLNSCLPQGMCHLIATELVVFHVKD